MSGLRELQKEMRRQAIADAAIELFQRQGFQNTTIEQIARHAGVSAPTVFKYFNSKQEIILEMLKEADNRAVLDLRDKMREFDDPVDTLCHLESLLVSYSLEVLPAPLWRELLPLILSNEREGLPQAYREMNAALQAQIASVLRDLQARGKLHAGLDVELTAFLLNDYSHLQLLRLVSAAEPDREAHARQVRLTTQLIFQGMRPD
ncbi:TetR/AcrR family transcriptional regulator [Pseudomonas huaxiensis]|uniref:TetR/AcrR family transcriptional regulator n=1 Tax=Pseudomonas huaxiensis TaxID=2213017 RepID=UPI000DA6557B|nr:TetR/AcrR family transcriptional regulator [Pseudomonas huaxiensis]